jgi:hypothetical protein
MNNTEAFHSDGIRKIIWVLAVFSLLYYAWMMVDLITHPFDLGSNAQAGPYLFRWLSAFCGTFTVVVAIFILRRSPGNIIGLLLVIFGVGAAGWSQRIDLGSDFANLLALVTFNIYFFLLAFPSLSALLFHFPTGKVYPLRFTGFAWGLVLFQAAAGIVSILGVPSFQNGTIPNSIFIPALMPLAGIMNASMALAAPLAAITTLFLRYRGSGQRERLQIKWLAWLASMAVVLTIFNALVIPEYFDGIPTNKAGIGLRIFSFLYWQIFPAVAIGIALLRYRLWDIDFIIRRTLLYSALTITLGMIYFSCVVLLQRVLGWVTGESTLAIVMSTLVIAGLFERVRRQLQMYIDKQFYRNKYDAALAMEEFSSAARREVEIARLTTSLVGVVDKTVQPERVSVWLRSRGHQARRPGA